MHRARFDPWKLVPFAAVAIVAFAVSAGSVLAAGPTTWQAMAGTGDATGVAANKFYPTALTIDVGDTVTWHAQGNAHVIALLAPGQTPPAPDSPQTLAPAGGSSYDGSTFVSSGLVLPLPPGVPAPPGTVSSYSLSFPSAGTFQFHCLIHPGMSGSITVQPAGTAYPQTQADLDAAAAAAKAADLATGHALEASFSPTTTTNADGTKTYGLAAGLGKDGIEILRYISGKLNLRVGDSIVWTNYSNGEPHSVSFGTEPSGPAANAPAGGATYAGTGWTSSGLFLGAPIPGTHSYKLTFTKAGTYKYFCVLHDVVGMVGSVTVSAAAPQGGGGGVVPTLPPTATVGAPAATHGASPLGLAAILLAAALFSAALGLGLRLRQPR